VVKAASAIQAVNKRLYKRIPQRHKVITLPQTSVCGRCVDARLTSAYFQGYFGTWQKNKLRKGIVAKKYFNLWH
jgi:hypothetical protein